MSKSRVLLVLAILLMLVELFGGLGATTLSIWFSHRNADTEAEVAPVVENTLIIVCTHFWLVGGAVIDVIITSTIAWCLWQKRSTTDTRR